MGFFDKIKDALGGDSKPHLENVKGPSRVLKDAGIDPSCLNCKIGADGTLTVTGTVESGAERDKIVSVLNGMPNVSKVVNEINVGAAKPEPAPASIPESAPKSGKSANEASQDDERTYTVKNGDTLWNISKEMYGNGSKYMKIFEANTGLLTNPDKIFPGQVLNIPTLED
jgi:nucleoid-associated protein YgaU